MRLIKLALISFFVFFAIVTAISLLIPSHVRISKAINISHTSDSLYSLIANRSQWRRWHPAFKLKNIDSLLQVHEITITPVVNTDSLVTVHWQQAGKNPVVNSWQIHRFSASDSAALQWYMDFQLPWYPWQKFSSLFYEKTYGTMMTRGLNNIDSILRRH